MSWGQRGEVWVGVWDVWTHPAEIMSCSLQVHFTEHSAGHGSTHQRLTAASGAAVADVGELDRAGDLVLHPHLESVPEFLPAGSGL